MMNLIKRVFLFLVTSLAITACEQNYSVAISDNWVRSNAPGQSVGAAYMTLLSAQDLTMVKAEADVAGSVEIHSMKMEDGVMKMRMLETLPLKAGQQEKLVPGGFHLMLFDLKKPLTAGENVTFTLHFKDAAGNESKQSIVSPIKVED
jgi:periplasmic copper chaperone A